MKKIHRILALTLSLCTVLLLLSGCGGGNANSSSPAPASEAAPTQSQTEDSAPAVVPDAPEPDSTADSAMEDSVPAAEDASPYTGSTVKGLSYPIGDPDNPTEFSLFSVWGMGFDEFLSATRGDGMVEMLAGLLPTSPLPASFASELEAAYRDFLIVGGMPEALLRWVETSDYGQVEAV